MLIYLDCERCRRKIPLIFMEERVWSWKLNDCLKDIDSRIIFGETF